MDKTEFHYFNWPFFEVSDRAKNLVRLSVFKIYEFNFVKYELANIHNYEVKFLIQCIYKEDMQFQYIRLQAYLAIDRMKGQDIKLLLDYDLNKLFH